MSGLVHLEVAGPPHLRCWIRPTSLIGDRPSTGPVHCAMLDNANIWDRGRMPKTKRSIAKKARNPPRRPRTTRPVQVSLTEDLLLRLDRDPDTGAHGRSAVVRQALEFYLRAKARRAVDEAVYRAYAGKADEIEAEMQDLMRAQVWPDD